MSTQRFTIKGKLPSLNDKTAADRAHWAQGAGLKKRCDETVMWYAKAAKVEPMAGRVHVTCAWYEPNRKRDPDNVRSGVKFILDGLVRLGVLGGDGHRHIAGFTDTFDFDAENPRIEVTLEETE